MTLAITEAECNSSSRRGTASEDTPAPQPTSDGPLLANRFSGPGSSSAETVDGLSGAERKRLAVWIERSERGPQAEQDAAGVGSAFERPVSSRAKAPTSRSAELQRRLQAERIGGRKTWGRYVDLMLVVRRQVSRDVDRWIDEVRWMQERSTA